MDVCTLASGSTGNAVLVCQGETRILLDAGISARRITLSLRNLGVEPSSLSGIFITHAHRDHMAGLATLTKQLALPVFATAACARQLCYRIAFLDDVMRTVEPGEQLVVGQLCISPFATPHDAQGSVGYSVAAENARLALCTDLGHLTPEVLQAVAGADLVVAETNHAEDMVRNGPYPYYLQQRILGPKGHLSNEMGAQLIRHAVEQGARTILLAHLSAENNTPARAMQVTADVLQQAEIDPVRQVQLSVAPRDRCSSVFRLGLEQTVYAFSQKGGLQC